MTTRTQGTPGPFTDEQAKTIRQKAVYWREVRERDDKGPLLHEVQGVFGARLETTVADVLLHAAEFCADPVRRAAPDLLAALEAIIEGGEMAADGLSAAALSMGRAALAKAQA